MLVDVKGSERRMNGDCLDEMVLYSLPDLSVQYHYGTIHLHLQLQVHLDNKHALCYISPETCLVPPGWFKLKA